MSVFRCFAVHKNVTQLLKVDSSSNAVQCVDGIRAIAMAMVIWHHVYSKTMYKNAAKFSNASDLFTYYFRPLAVYGVDTFLLLGGIFRVYSTVSKYKKHSSKVMSVFRCFAVHKNVTQLLKVDSSSNAVQCVDGIRAIAMAMVIWHHVYSKTMYKNAAKFSNASDLFTYYFRPLAVYGVDTFLLLGGIFRVYSTVSKYKKRAFLRNLHMHLLNRLVRMYPVISFATLAQASIFNHIGDGPHWNKMAKSVESCWLLWWANLLFLQNIVTICQSNFIYGCLIHTWYLALDMQLFVVSTLVLMWMFGKKKTAWTALVVAIILSLACSTIFSFLFNFNQALYDTALSPTYLEQLLKQYITLPCRSPPYFVGMITGYILIHLNNQKQTFRFGKVWIWFLWILTIIILNISIFGMSIIWDAINRVLHNIINSNMVAFWSVAVSWIIIACHIGYGGPVNWFLSLKQWKLLSRLSYAMYIFHYPIYDWMFSVQSDDEVILKTGHITRFQYFLSAFLASVVITFIVTVLIEQPVLNLYKLMLGRMNPVKNVKTDAGDKENISCVALSSVN